MINALRHSSWMGKWAARAFLLACLGGTTTAVAVYAPKAATHQPTALEEQIKAAMIFKFLSYIEWPEAAFESAESPYRIWILGASRVEAELQEIVAERAIKGRPVEAFKTNKVKKISNPHLVYVGRHAERHVPRLARLAKKQGFVIVTENAEGLLPGSVINLRLINERMGFNVSLANAQAFDLKLSARLLSVAASIEQEVQ